MQSLDNRFHNRVRDESQIKRFSDLFRRERRPSDKHREFVDLLQFPKGNKWEQNKKNSTSAARWRYVRLPILLFSPRRAPGGFGLAVDRPPPDGSGPSSPGSQGSNDRDHKKVDSQYSLLGRLFLYIEHVVDCVDCFYTEHVKSIVYRNIFSLFIYYLI